MDMQQLAPAWHTSRWFNGSPLTLADLRGRVVVAHAFQMLCAACAVQAFANEPVAVVGLHTVFEHHAEQGSPALDAFLYEYRYTFPVGVDAYTGDYPLPQTVRAYAMQGTPTLLLIDALGRLREQHSGVVDDLMLVAALGELLAEAKRAAAH